MSLLPLMLHACSIGLGINNAYLKSTHTSLGCSNAKILAHTIYLFIEFIDPH